MAEIDLQRAKRIASGATTTAKKGAKKALKFAETTRQSKLVNYLLPSDHKRSRRGEMVLTPLEVEKALQRQRLLQMTIIAPLMLYPLVRNPGRMYKWAMALAGVSLMYTAYQQYSDTRESV